MPTPSRRPAAALAALLALLAPSAARAQEAAASAPVTNVRYEVHADQAALTARRLRVTMTFDVTSQAPVILSLPNWTPGAYETSDFARFVAAFSSTQGGAPLRWDKADVDSWRVRPTGAGRVTVALDVAPPSAADNAMTWMRPDVALFNGTNLFLYPEGGTTDFAATVTVRAEAAHRVATGMTPAGAPRTYTAPNYHELVDMPFMVGAFDLDSALVSGRTFRYATYPVGSVAGDARRTAWEQIRRIVPVQSAIFGDVPWPHYTLIQLVDSTSGGYSGLEHANSHVNIVAPAFIGSDFQPLLYAHEIFHAWNVKRLRPADLVPYRYDRRQPTPWLWVSEGVTDYYADLSVVRAGAIDLAGFYGITAGKIAEIGALAPFAVEDASIEAWIRPTNGTAGTYYPKGSLAGLMLDIAIRDGSSNRNSLDTVLRELYESTYKRTGRGFTAADWWGAVSRAAGGRSFEEFNARYIDGRDPYPWPTVLALVGLRLAADSTPRLGLQTIADSATGAVMAVDVTPGSAAAQAGVRAGDRIMSIGDVTVTDNLFPLTFRARYATRPAGSAVPIVVRRGTETLTLPGRLTFAEGAPRIEEIPNAPARAVRLRNGILRGTVER